MVPNVECARFCFGIMGVLIKAVHCMVTVILGQVGLTKRTQAPTAPLSAVTAYQQEININDYNYKEAVTMMIEPVMVIKSVLVLIIAGLIVVAAILIKVLIHSMRGWGR